MVNNTEFTFSKNMSLGFFLAMAVYGVGGIIWAVNLRSDVQHMVESLNDHKDLGAHGKVPQRLTGLEIRMGHLESWRAIGGRFTREQGEDLERRIKRIEQDLSSP